MIGIFFGFLAQYGGGGGGGSTGGGGGGTGYGAGSWVIVAIVALVVIGAVAWAAGGATGGHLWPVVGPTSLEISAASPEALGHAA